MEPRFRLAVPLLAALAALPTASVRSAATAAREGRGWRLENSRIRVLVDPDAGTLSVHDKAADYTWRQPGPAAAPKPGPALTIRQAQQAPKIDGQLDDWRLQAPIRITHKMLADARRVDNAQDCSAQVWCTWDANHLYLAAKVQDDALCFGEPGIAQWWQKDSMELWAGARQIGLNLSPKGSRARSANSALTGAQIALTPTKEGYIVEAALPWKVFGRPAGQVGQRFPFAVGVNDADATGQREGQIYFPATWTHSQPDTFAQAVLADAEGHAPPAKPPTETAKFRDAKAIAEPTGIQFQTDVQAQGNQLALTLRLTLPDDAPDLVVEVDLADRDTKIGRFVALAPLVLDTPKAALAIADYCNGHLYPLDLKPFPRRSMTGNRIDMPWVGIVDMDKGHGYALILDTSDDCGVHIDECAVGKRRILAPRVQWWPSHRTFRYPRRMRYRFSPKGGYVALAKAYRAYAQKLGLIVTLAEKAKANANVRRLFGAPDLWGNSSLQFAREAKALGVARMIIHGHSAPKDMAKVNDLGYLSSRYDNYTDILPLDDKHKEIASNHAPLPDHAVLKADGKRMTAWLTFDKKTQFMKRCPSLWVPAAKQVVPKELEKYPFLGRFIDVTTAEGLYECYDPKHSLTRAAKRECGVALEGYVQSQNLVVGGEHGLWWGVPHMCYIEGMMSGGSYSWPAGHLKHPKTKDEEFTSPWGHKLGKFERYEKFGIGHEYRVPLWELVFHDCIVTTWYWGDASDWLLDAAPEVTSKKDAFNVLYGTIPLMWANAQGSWLKDRQVFLRTYRNTCKLHEQIAGEEMLTHEFVTPDRAVQRTMFSSGTEVVVNFGDQVRQVTVKGKAFLLPKNGFAVRGPAAEQSLSIVNGREVTTIQTPGYWYSDAAWASAGPTRDAGVTMRSADKGRIHIIVAPIDKTLSLRPEAVAKDWDFDTTRVYLLDEQGERVKAVDCRTEGGKIELGPVTAQTRYEALCRPASRLPDLAIEPEGVKLAKAAVAQGDRLALEVHVRNLGFAPAEGSVAVYAGQVAAARRLASQAVDLGPSDGRTLHIDVPTARIDGRRHLVVTATLSDKAPELCSLNNSTAVAVQVKPDLSIWPQRIQVVVDAGPLDRVDEPVVLPIDFRPILKRLGLQGPLDPAGTRVAEADPKGAPGDFVPAQFDPAADFDATRHPKGELCWLMPGRTPKGSQRRFVVLLRTGPAALLPPQGRLWQPETSTIDAAGYVARFTHGVIESLAPKVDGKAGPDFLRSIILSSKATGWSREDDSTVERFAAHHVGPVRCTVVVYKTLKAGVKYEKTYTFYPRRFDLRIDLNKPAGGLYSRAHYKLPGTYVDDKGIRAKVDGDGSENPDTYGKNKDPRWYALLGKGWAHSCIALGKFDHVAYWDTGYMGAIGLVGPRHKDVRMSYVVHGEQKDAAFAQADWERLNKPVQARLVP